MSTPTLPAQNRNDADTTPSTRTADPAAAGPPTSPDPQPVIESAPEPRNRFGLSGAQVAGSALAAMTSALAASGLGVAGTLLGAALGSVVITVGGAVYAHTFRSARRRIVTIVPAATRPSRTAPLAARAEAAYRPTPVAAADPVPGRDGAARRWRTVATVLAGLLIALGAITALEVVLGHPIADSSRSGTTITDTVTHGGSSQARIEPTPMTGQPGDPAPNLSATSAPTPSGSATPVPSPSQTPTQSGPTSPSPTSSPEPTPTSS